MGAWRVLRPGWFLGYKQKQGIGMVVFLSREGSGNNHARETSRLNQLRQGSTFKPQVTRKLSIVEGPIFVVEIADAQGATGLEDFIKSRENPARIGDMVQDQQRIDQIKALG